MNEVVFNYRNRQGLGVKLDIPTVEVQKFQETYKAKVILKFSGNLVNPKVEVVVSNDGTKILDCHILADYILN